MGLSAKNTPKDPRDRQPKQKQQAVPSAALEDGDLMAEWGSARKPERFFDTSSDEDEEDASGDVGISAIEKELVRAAEQFQAEVAAAAMMVSDQGEQMGRFSN